VQGIKFYCSMKNSKKPGKASHLNCIENCRSDQFRNGETRNSENVRVKYSGTSIILHTMLVIPCSFSTLMLSTLSLWTSNCIRLMASSMHFEPTNNITNKTIWEIKHSNHIKHQWTKQIRYIFHKFMTPEIAIHEPTVLNAKD